MKNDDKQSKSFVFSLIDPEQSIEIPAYKEGTARGKNYVTWGESNKFPNMLLELSQNSPTLSSIVNGTIELIKGEDIALNEDIHIGQQDLYYWPYLNKYDDTIYDLVENLVRDYMIQGMFVIQVVYNKLGNIAEIYHIPAEFIRMNEDRDTIYFNKKWGKYSTNSIIYNAFDDNADGSNKAQIYVYSNSGRRQTYGISPQLGCLEDLVAENYAAKYIRKSLQNGLSARYIIDLPGTANLTDDQKSEIEDGITERFTGWQNSGEFALYFNNGDKPMTVTKVDIDNSNEVFTSIRLAARNNIFVTNHATPQLFGDPSAATGFSEQEFNEAYNLYDKMTLTPIKNCISTAIGKIFHMNDAITFTKENKNMESNGQ